MLEHKAVQTFIELKIISLSLHSSTCNCSDGIKFNMYFQIQVKSNIKGSFHKILFYYEINNKFLQRWKNLKFIYIAYSYDEKPIVSDLCRTHPNLSYLNRSFPMFPELFRICDLKYVQSLIIEFILYPITIYKCL